jgi:hypothetical protein
METGGVASGFVRGPAAPVGRKADPHGRNTDTYLCVVRAPHDLRPCRLLAPLRKRLSQPIEPHKSVVTVRLRSSVSE